MSTPRSLVAALALGGLLLPTSQAAAFQSSILQFGGTGVPMTSSGGGGVPTAFLEDTGTVINIDSTQEFHGITLSSATTGTLRVALFSTATVSPSAPTKRLGAFGFSDPLFIDAFTISSGSSGLSNGDPVQILVQAKLDGAMELLGSPSGGSGLDFDVFSGGQIVNFGTGGLVPPQDFPPPGLPVGA